MVEIIGVRFKEAGRTYHFSPGGRQFGTGDKVIVETAKGVECGEVVLGNRMMEEERLVMPLKTVIRPANERDMRILEQNRQKEITAMKICQEKIAAHGLAMKLADVECTFDNNKLLFYFTAETRIDFRELVKDLASVFRTRIELRQIGVRDEAKMLGGIGVCGRAFCCKTFLPDFQPVSIKMAKEQGLSLNTTKISGTCGRLMCCLKYEQDYYEEQLASLPKVGAYVKTPKFKGYVEEVNVLSGKIRVKPEKSDDPAAVFGREDIKVIRDGKGRQDRLDKEEFRALKKLEDK
ncbi:MAG: stage 0 sporulation family protein [Ruminococcus sp.]|nr:stage 0 sporulation family protein [Ruminococcus sp.]